MPANAELQVGPCARSKGLPMHDLLPAFARSERLPVQGAWASVRHPLLESHEIQAIEPPFGSFCAHLLEPLWARSLPKWRENLLKLVQDTMLWMSKGNVRAQKGQDTHWSHCPAQAKQLMHLPVGKSKNVQSFQLTKCKT